MAGMAARYHETALDAAYTMRTEGAFVRGNCPNAPHIYRYWRGRSGYLEWCSVDRSVVRPGRWVDYGWHRTTISILGSRSIVKLPPVRSPQYLKEMLGL